MLEKISVRFLILLQFVVGCNTLFGQIKCKIENYSTEDGLSHNIIRSIIKDQEGFMWFATWDGISRFDGRNFITFKATAGDHSDLENNRIDMIKEDAFGYIWLKAYDSRIYRFDKKRQIFLSISKILRDAKVEFDLIHIAKDGNVWLTSIKNGIYLAKQNKGGKIEIINFKPGNKSGFALASNQINFITEDRNHTVWVGSDKGLDQISKSDNGNYNSTRIVSNTNVLSFFFSRDKEMWFGTEDGALVSYNQASMHPARFSISTKGINSITASKTGDLLYATSSAGTLITFNTRTFKTEAVLKVSESPIYKIYQDSNGLFWIEPDKKGVLMVDRQNKIHHFSQNTDASIYMLTNSYEIFEDNFRRVWVKMKGGGFGNFNQKTKTFDYFYNKPGTTDRRFSNTVSTKYFDPSGILWLSTTDGGIQKVIFQQDSFQQQQLVSNAFNALQNEVRALYTDKNGRLWMASKSGELNIFRNGLVVRNVFPNFDIKKIGLVYTILEDSKGNIWLGTKGNGLYKATPIDISHSSYTVKQFKNSRKDSKSISSDLIYSVIEDNTGHIWIGTYGSGINLAIENKKSIEFVHNFPNYPIKEASKVRVLKQGSRGEIWVGSTNGLITFNPGNYDPQKMKFKRYIRGGDDKYSLNSNDILFILRDSDNKMWLSTAGGGLNLAELKRGGLRFINFTKKNGLSSDFILSMAEDHRKNIWLATENGISKFSLSTHTFRNFDSYDGLAKTNFSESAISKSANGHLIFGSKNGYLVIDPDQIQLQKDKSHMVFTAFEVNNKVSAVNSEEMPLKLDINYNDDIEMDYLHNTVSIYYTTLDYRSGKKQKYAYRLKGLDDNWYLVGNQRRATFTNLAPGDYEFEVKSINPELYSNIPHKKLSFTITPPFWRTNLAYFIYLLVGLALLEMTRRITVSMIRLRNNVVVEKKMTELKLSFFTNISHELRTPLTLIVNPIDEIARNEKLSEQGNEYIELARKNTDRLVRFVNQLLDFRKVQSGTEELYPERVELVSFITEIVNLFALTGRERNITITTEFFAPSLYANLDRSKMDIVIYNLLSNAVKFSPDNTTITLKVLCENERLLKITLTDDGPGVDEKKLDDIFKLYYESKVGETKNVGTGIGLALCREYIQLHQGTIWAENNKNGGLTVFIEIDVTDKILNTNKDAQNQFDHKLPVYDSIRAIKTEFNAPPTNESDRPMILIVEDNNDLRGFLKSQLRNYYKVMEAENGREGFEMAKKTLPDLILSDIMMPEMDGIELLQALKSDVVTSHIPLVLLTAKSSVDNQLEGLNYGADQYITKPFNTEILLAKVKNLITLRKSYFETLQNSTKTISLEPGEIVITTKDEHFLRDVIALVETHYTDPEFTIDALIKSLNVSRATFNRKFKSLTNMTAVEYVKDIRVKRGRQYLKAGERDIATIAYKVGFNNAGYFSTCFKEVYGVSPSDYIKQNQ